MACYAYYPESPDKDEKEESYDEHVLGIVNYMEKSKFFNDLVMVLSRRLSWNEDEIHDLVLLSGAFHDIGKIHKDYQISRKGYRNHEIISGGLLFKALRLDNKYLDPGDNTVVDQNLLIGTILIRPIVYHHYAQREYNKLKFEVKFSPFQDCINVLETTYKEVEKYMKTEFGKRIINKVLSHVFDVYNKKQSETLYLPEEIKSNFLEYRFYRFVSGAVLSILNEADGSVAMNNRKKESPRNQKANNEVKL